MNGESLGQIARLWGSFPQVFYGVGGLLLAFSLMALWNGVSGWTMGLAILDPVFFEAGRMVEIVHTWL